LIFRAFSESFLRTISPYKTLRVESYVIYVPGIARNRF
jgi:hypothetical protein